MLEQVRTLVEDSEAVEFAGVDRGWSKGAGRINRRIRHFEAKRQDDGVWQIERAVDSV